MGNRKGGPLQSLILEALRAGPLDSTQLAHATGRKRDSISYGIEVLRARGQVERVPDTPRVVYIWRLKR